MNEPIDTAHKAMVDALFKPGADILDTLDPHRCELIHLAIAIPSEAGELADVIKKHVIYDQPLDEHKRAAIIEEAGDLEFFLAALYKLIGTSRNYVLTENMLKLAKRYPNFTYADAAAKARADKAAETVPDFEPPQLPPHED